MRVHVIISLGSVCLYKAYTIIIDTLIFIQIKFIVYYSKAINELCNSIIRAL